MRDGSELRFQVEDPTMELGKKERKQKRQGEDVNDKGKVLRKGCVYSCME